MNDLIPESAAPGSVITSLNRIGFSYMPLKTKSIYDERQNSDGTRVLVTRFYPRGVKRTHFDLWIHDLSPEAALLKEYRSNNLGWREFSRRYKSQMRSSPDSKRAIQSLVEILEMGRNVTLLCYEREGEKCHRYLLKSIIESSMKRKIKTLTSSTKKS